MRFTCREALQNRNAMTLLQITNTITPAAAADTIAGMATGIPVAAGEAESISLLYFLLKGGYLMIPIGLLSVLTVYVFFERWFFIRKTSAYDRNFMNTIREFMLSDKTDAAMALCRNSPTPYSRVIEKGLLRMGLPKEEIRDSMEDAGRQEIYRLEKNLSILSITGRIAPMLGFIGTIIGVITIFYDISLTDDISIPTISRGLYQKMVASAAGLTVGIVAFVCYHSLNLMIDKVVGRIDNCATQFMDLLYKPGK